MERLLAHRRQIHSVPGLAEIFLSDLQLNRLVRLVQRAEKGRGGLAPLEIDGPVLDLDHDIIVEFPIEVVEIVVCGARSTVLGIAPVDVMVVNEASIEDKTAVRLQRASNYIRRIRVRSTVS